MFLPPAKVVAVPITLLNTFPPQTEQALKKKKGGEVEISLKLNEKGSG
jgi:hypothetical protein